MITTLMENLTNHTLVLSIGWTLFHFLWQAALVGVVTAISLRIMCRSSAQAKYVAACAGLAVMALLPIATFAYQITVAAETGCQTGTEKSLIAQARDSKFTGIKNDIDLSQKLENAQELVNLNSLSQPAWSELDDTATAARVGWFSRLESAANALRSWLPWCVMIWMAGVLVLAIRMLLGVQRVWRWKRESVVLASGELVTAVERLSRRMKLRQRVRILETAREAVPAVVGWIRPAILVPTSMLSGLTTTELESIMAHELAHIRRYDYPINLLQTVVETVLFYHPAVWWISNRIRAERENCCDDIAVEVCGNRVAFARALARMEELRCRDERLAIAANGGSLLGRIRRILGTEPVPTGSWCSAGAMILGSLGLLLGGMWMAVASAVPAERGDTGQINAAQFVNLEVKQGRVEVESRGHENGPARMERPGVKVLATHTYSQTKRVSMGWVEVNRVRSPVDVGVEHDGIIVYHTLMFDIVAVDAKTEKSIWKIDWGKTTPMWQTVSIVELDREGKSELAVELFAAVKKTGELVYQYVSLKTGKKVEPPKFLPNDSHQQQDSKSDGAAQLKFQTAERDGDRITRAVIKAFPHGRSATELVRHFALGMRDPSMLQAGSTTNMESIVSASKPNYLLEDRMEAAEVLFNLPEGSGLRAEFSGKNVEINRGEKATTVVVTNGKIELIDAGGVIRAWASPDGGAEQLVIGCREDLGEVVMAMTTRRIKESPEYPSPPVQVVMNTNTGAPKDEGDPPHGAIRYEILQDDEKPDQPVRMKMKWRYEMKRLLEEAKAESGLSAEELIDGKQNQSSQMRIPLPRIPRQTLQVASKQDDSDDSSWGRLAENSGLRSRLTLSTEKPTVGQPILLRLEIKNFGEKPTSVDAQNYEPFRVLRVIQEDGKSAKFIGMTPQTSGEDQQLKPGESLTLWEKVDANGLFLINAGRYKFMAEGGEWATQTLWRDSNTVEVQIADGEQSPLNRLLEKLGEGLPKKWEVANGMGLAKGWKGVFLTHVPTGLKSDATGIQIWFTDKKLPNDFELGSGDQKQVVTQLGQSKLGFMNVAAQPRTLDIWPGYLEHIRKASKHLLNH